MKNLLMPKEIKQRCDQYVIGQDLPKETLAVAVHNHFKHLSMDSDSPHMQSGSDDVEVERSNILLLGSSGTGKTLLASSLARILGMPLVIADTTTLTQAIGMTVRYLAYIRKVMGEAVEDFTPFAEAYEAADWSEFEKLPAFEAANRRNAYQVYLSMEEESLLN